MTRLGLLMMLGLMVGGVGGCGEDIKVWVVKHPNGQVMEEYQYYHHPETNQRIKDGWYNSYYENGEYWEVGTYKDNKRDGKWGFFTEDGKETRGIWRDGKKWSGEFWINVKTDDGWTETEDEIRDEWGEVGVFRGLVTYDEGEWNGFLVLYYENGNKRREGLWRRGGQGKWVEYYDSGGVEWEGNNVDGKREGKWVEYYEGGKRRVEREGNYVDGKLEGKVVLYYESGGVEKEGNFVDGKQEGKLVWYDEEGNIIDGDIYQDGVCVEMCDDTPYGSAADVEKYVAQIAPYVQQISQLQSQYETALAAQQGDSNDRRGTGRNLANKAEEVGPELRTLQTTFDTVEPPAALAPFHRDIRKLIALRLSAYDKIIDGWADEKAGGDRHKAIYGDVERAQDEANQLILALNAQMQKIQTALA
ncbi:MAG: hypothetical protein VX948_06255, partial [Candidatus Latescibacterota bacterium]|nr:hypothetical protein [Candidatus Latescibacterota bacterium]